MIVRSPRYCAIACGALLLFGCSRSKQPTETADLRAPSASVPSTRGAWLTPVEVVRTGFARSRVVMMNDVHSQMLRCVRSRELGLAILPVAHELGVRHIALESMSRDVAATSNRTRRLPDFDGSVDYLGQAEMRALVQRALDLGWTLHAYDQEEEEAGERDTVEAANLTAIVGALPEDGKLLVWAGDGHLFKERPPADVGKPAGWMGLQFGQMSGIDPFVIDQSLTISFQGGPLPPEVGQLVEELRRSGRTEGARLAAELAAALGQRTPRAEAFVISTRNTLE